MHNKATCGGWSHLAQFAVFGCERSCCLGVFLDQRLVLREVVPNRALGSPELLAHFIKRSLKLTRRVAARRGFSA